MSPAQLFLFFRDTRHITSLIDFQKIRFSIVPAAQPDSADQVEADSVADAGTKSILRASGSEGAIKHLVENLDLRWKVRPICAVSTSDRRLSRWTRALPFGNSGSQEALSCRADSSLAGNEDCRFYGS
jgi:hypothetical protein